MANIVQSRVLCTLYAVEVEVGQGSDSYPDSLELLIGHTPEWNGYSGIELGHRNRTL